MIAVRYHEATKHHFNRFARSLGYLDWATQPNPFRRYDGAPVRPLPRSPASAALAAVPYRSLYEQAAAPHPIDEHAIGEFLRCSMGLSAWKQYGQSRWALRVNPSTDRVRQRVGVAPHAIQIAHATIGGSPEPIRRRLDRAALLRFEASTDSRLA